MEYTDSLCLSIVYFWYYNEDYDFKPLILIIKYRKKYLKNI